MTVASKWFDLVVGIDLHFEIVPASPAPIPFPHPFIGIVWDPVGLVMDELMGAAMELLGAPPQPGPVLVGGMIATATGDEASMPTGHILLPPGVSWAPIPKVPLPWGPGKKPKPPDLPLPPPGDAMLFFGSATVEWRGGRAVRMGDMALSCSDPVRLPTSFVVSTFPTGVFVGGPPAPDWMAIASAVAFGMLRTKWASNLIHGAVNKFVPKRLNRARDFLHDAACFVTGHPVNVVNGSMFTTWEDLELPGPIPLSLTRRYRSSFCDRDVGLGYGWTHSLNQQLWLEEGRVVLLTEDGRELEFDTWDYPDQAMRKGDEIFDPVSRLTLKSLGQFCWQVISPDGLIREFGPVHGESPVNKDRGLVRLRHIKNLAGDQIELQYDEGARLSTVYDSGGRTLKFEYGRDGRLSRLWVPTAGGDGLRQHAQYLYSDDGDLVEVKDAVGKSVKFTYDRHNLVRETDRNGVNFYFQYEGWGPFARCTRTWGDGRILDHVITYDVKGRRSIVEDSFGNAKVYEWGLHGVMKKVIDERGGVTSYEYDELLRRTVETDPLGNTTKTTYDDRSNPIMVIDAAGGVTRIRYDGDRPIQVELPNSAQWRWTYDRAGRRMTEVDPLGATTRYHYRDRRLVAIDSATGQRTQFQYDGSGNLITVAHPDGTTEQWRHDALGNVTIEADAKGNQRKFAHDGFSRVAQITEPDGNVRRFAYDGEGNLVQATDKLRSVQFTYEGLDKLASRTIDGRTVRYEYDNEQRLVAFINELGHAYRFERDPAGDVLAETIFDETKKIFERDAAGNVTKVFRPGVRNTTTYERDPLGRVVSAAHSDGLTETYVYDEGGDLVEASNGDATVKFERDALGRVVKEHQGEQWVASQYDHRGLRIGIESSLGARQTIERNAMGDFVGLHAQRGGLKWQAAITRDQHGLEVDRQLPGQVRSYWWRDAVGRPTQHWIGREKQRVRGRKYGWGVDDRLELIQEEGQGETRFQHDRMGALVGVTYPNGHVDRRVPDPVGNLFRDAEQRTREFGPVGALRKESTAEGIRVYRYDPEGQLVEREEPGGEVWRYEWDGAGRLRKVVRPDEGEIEFAYDPLGRRVSKTADGETTAWVWDGDVLLHECTGDDGGDLTTWVFDPESFSPAARLNDGDGVHSVVTDHLGTPLSLVDAEGAPQWQGSIDAWGRMSVAGEARLCPWRFPGQYEDAETGLYYNRFRYFDPQVGGYVSRDPIGLRGGEGLYGYVEDPLVAGDPLGLSKKDYQGAAAGDSLVRRGAGWESTGRLSRQAEAAAGAGVARNGVPYGHGVSVTTPESNLKLSRDPSDAKTATRSAFEDNGFEVRHTPTKRDPFHHTVQLPQPVTPEVARRFNEILGRKKK